MLDSRLSKHTTEDGNITAFLLMAIYVVTLYFLY